MSRWSTCATNWLEEDGIYTERVELPGDPVGKPLVRLGHRSMFAPVSGRTYYGAYYDVAETNFHHTGGRHDTSSRARHCPLMSSSTCQS